MERARHRLEQDLCGRDRHGLRDPLGQVPSRREQAIVGADEETAVSGSNGEVAVTPDRRVNDRQDDRLVPDLRQGVRELERTSTDVERRNAM